MHISHPEIAQFAKSMVNDKADEYRAQAGRVREKVTGFLNEHPGFALKNSFFQEVLPNYVKA